MRKVMDGNTAASTIAYKFSEIASIYPITPSSPMAADIDDKRGKGTVNLFGTEVNVIEMQSEAGASGTMHGALLSGSLASTFTASQGLLLMIPNMYKIAGEGLPGVMHVASRTVATHALSIFGDHSDIYACRQTGFCMLASSSVQEAHDMAAVTHLSSIKASLPFLHFFDGFRTSHELNTIECLNDEDLKPLIDTEKLNEFRKRSMNLSNKDTHGTNENEDIYFQSVEGRNSDYNRVPDIVNHYMEKINEIQNTDYKPFNYFGVPNAKFVLVAMGSVCETIKKVIKALNFEGHSLGLVEVHLYRPFSKEYLLSVLPKSVKRIAVLDRTKEAGSIGEPLYLDIVAALKDINVDIYGGRYGLSSKNTSPSDIYSVCLMLEENPKENFTVGIEDDVTNLSVPYHEYHLKDSAKELLVYGYGSDGMVGASKDLLKVLGDKNFVQGYFEYDSKKSGGVTISHLRFDDIKIEAPYYVEHPNIIVVTKDSYLNKYEMFNNISKNGVVIINTSKDFEDLNILNENKKNLKEKEVTIFTINAGDIASKNNLKGKISMIFEAVLLKLLGVDNYEEILTENIKNKFKTKGEEVINNNIACVKEALDGLIAYRGAISLSKEEEQTLRVFDVIEERKGNTLKVSELLPYKNGRFPGGSSKLEKRNVTDKVPNWNKDKCIECGQCAFVCPHAVIRPFVVEKDGEYGNDGISLIGDKDGKYNFIISVSEADCTGCGACIDICPGKNGEKALAFGGKNERRARLANTLFNFYENINPYDKFTIKGSQLEKPAFEFSGACAGCGEASYIKLLTQLFKDRLVIANATGCSSIYGGSVPSTPYSIPWANSLFEDNAEFGLGLYSGYKYLHEKIKKLMNDSLNEVSSEVKELFTEYISSDDYETSKDIYEQVINKENIPEEILNLKDYILKPSVWAIGGDGWAYDIGFGGIDHVLSTNEDINILVLDTEVYSNTGGQASKSSHVGQVAQFASSGKKTKKKDLFRIAMSYPNIYIASISMGANPMQTIKAFKEAEEHKGPSLIIAYSPCIEQGIKKGMNCAQNEQKLSVECGYNILMRYKDEKLTIDSKEPDFEKYREFLDGEVRYNSLKLKNKEEAEKLLEINKENAKKRYDYYKSLISIEKGEKNEPKNN